MKLTGKHLLLLLLLPFTLAVAGGPAGAQTGGAAEPPADPELPYPPPRPPQIGDVLHLPTGFYVDFQAMLRAAGDARIAYVGETHDNPASHRLQLQVLQALAERYPGRVAMGMEMFNPTQQPVLDRWVAGELSEREFIKESDWYNVWRLDFAYYRDLLLFARERKIPVIGLNAERELLQQLRQAPADLPEELRAQLPELDLADPYHRRMTEAVFADHPLGEGQFERFYRAQVLWDEMMAQSVARYLAAAPEGTRMVVVAGSQHVRHGAGIPRRAFRRLALSYVLVGNHELDLSPEKQQTLMQITPPKLPMPAYDYVVYTAYETLPQRGVKLGIRLEGTERGPVIRSVSSGSPAERAGLRPGDVIRQLDGEATPESFDVVYLLQQKDPGSEAQLLIERDGQQMQVRAAFPEAPPAETK